MSRRILITGGTGIVGSNVLRAAERLRDTEIVATVYKRRSGSTERFETVLMDLEERGSIRNAVKNSAPECVIHCAAPRDEDRLEQEHEWGWAVMVEGTRALAEACRDFGARLVFVSSDWVFGQGGNPPYNERSAPCPVNYFGLLKSIGEVITTSICPNSAVARIAGVYGVNWADPGYVPQQEGVGGGWLANFYVNRLGRNEPVSVWTDYLNIFFNPSLASDVADALLTIAEGNHTGIFHCCGRESVSRLELAYAVAEVFGFPKNLIETASKAKMDASAPQGKLRPPRDSRMDAENTEIQLQRRNIGAHEGLLEFKRQMLR